jgi:hypothetical protein
MGDSMTFQDRIAAMLRHARTSDWTPLPVTTETPAATEGICELVTVPACDELPYVFELKRGERLAFSLAATANISVVLCDEPAYDEWLDSGLRSEVPADCYVVSRETKRHALSFVAPLKGVFLVVLVNAQASPADVAVTAVAPA